MTFRVTWPSQVQSSRLPEEYATVAAALRRAADLVATGHQFATYYEVDDESRGAA